MNWLSILRAVLNFLYFFGWVSALSAPFIAFIALSGVDVNAAGLNTTFIKNEVALYMVLTLIVVGYFFYLAMIHHLRKAVYLISPRQLLSTSLKNHLYKAGLFCVIGSLMTKLPSVLFKYIVSPLQASNYTMMRSGIDLGHGFDSVLVILTFGIFLIIFSKIIERSLHMQEENAMTI